MRKISAGATATDVILKKIKQFEKKLVFYFLRCYNIIINNEVDTKKGKML